MMKKVFDEPGYELSPFGHPHLPGVYVILMGKSDPEYGKYPLFPVYVGSSKCISKRVLSPTHHYRKLYNKFSETHNICVATKVTADYLKEEKLMIRKYQPELNKQFR